MRETDLHVFLDSVVRYYSQTTDTHADVKAPYLAESIEPQLSEYTGCIRITGGYTGNVLFTVPQTMLVALLARYGHRTADNSYLLDLVGEIANTIAGNAREYFGSGFQLSPPRVARGSRIGMSNSAGLKAYCIPIEWLQYKAKLIIAVQ